VLKRPQAARLLAVDRDARGTRLLLLARNESAVGSADGSALHIADPNVAERHAIVSYSRGRYYLFDLKSPAGTFVNGKRIRRRQRLKHGDVLRFGTSPPYRFLDPDAQKRRRWRRNLQLASLLAILIAFVLADHAENWGVVSVATLSKVVAVTKSSPAPKPVAPPIAVAVHAAAQPANRAERATTRPSPAAAASVIAVAASMPASTASAGTSLAAASAPPMTWLERINFYRGSNGLRPIRDDPRLSAAVAAHAHYLMSNFSDDILNARPIPADAYDEQPGRNGYSVEGAGVAQNAQLAWGCSTYDAPDQIDRWVEGPFHRLPMLDPYLADVGYGEASANGCWVAALRWPPPPEDVKPYPRAVEFPPEGSDIALQWIGFEAPDALSSCSGYERPVGLPITLQLGRLVRTQLTAHSLTEDGKPIEYCAFDAPGYHNPNPTQQEYGRWTLRNAGGIVLVPRAPMRPGSHYQVSITTNDVTYAWGFTVANTSKTTFTSAAPFPTPEPIATIAPTPIAPRPRRSAATPHRAIPAPVEPESAPAPASHQEPGVAGTSSNWLTVLNAYRTRLNLPPVVEDPQLSRGCLAHAKYLMMNYGRILARRGSVGALFHQETESMPGYSPEGLAAAHASDVVYNTRTGKTQDELMEQAIEWWMSEPFNRPQLLNPQLMRTGFGQYCTASGCVSVLNSIAGSTLAPLGGLQLPRPLEIPPDGASVKASAFGGEWPSPVSSCPGYPTTSPAITLNLGINVPARISDAHLTQTTGAAAGTIVDTCSYDFDSYTNPDAGAQAQGRDILRSFGEVVMMVRDPLVGGETYRVAMTVNGRPYIWSFTVLK
jgi:uncharacterized protein YkwD